MARNQHYAAALAKLRVSGDGLVRSATDATSTEIILYIDNKTTISSHMIDNSIVITNIKLYY